MDLKVGDKYQIELFSFPDPPKRLSYPEATGLRHLAFEVDDVNKAHQELKSKVVFSFSTLTTYPLKFMKDNGFDMSPASHP